MDVGRSSGFRQATSLKHLVAHWQTTTRWHLVDGGAEHPNNCFLLDFLTIHRQPIPFMHWSLECIFTMMIPCLSALSLVCFFFLSSLLLLLLFSYPILFPSQHIFVFFFDPFTSSLGTKDFGNEFVIVCALLVPRCSGPPSPYHRGCSQSGKTLIYATRRGISHSGIRVRISAHIIALLSYLVSQIACIHLCLSLISSPFLRFPPHLLCKYIACIYIYIIFIHVLSYSIFRICVWFTYVYHSYQYLELNILFTHMQIIP